MCIANIFKAKKIQMKLLLGKFQVALRKCKGNSKSLNATQLKHEGAIEKLIHHDERFQFLRAIRGSPPYFENTKKTCNDKAIRTSLFILQFLFSRNTVDTFA